jgi:multicomponent Na+:H+ antiporter subunit E
VIRLWYAVLYLGYIVVEITRGAANVARDAFTPGLGSRPQIVELPLRCRTDMEITLLASSITITPGTMTVGIAPAAPDGSSPPCLYVHGMYADDRQDLLDSLRDMERRLLRMTRGRREAG